MLRKLTISERRLLGNIKFRFVKKPNLLLFHLLCFQHTQSETHLYANESCLKSWVVLVVVAASKPAVEAVCTKAKMTVEKRKSLLQQPSSSLPHLWSKATGLPVFGLFLSKEFRIFCLLALFPSCFLGKSAFYSFAKTQLYLEQREKVKDNFQAHVPSQNQTTFVSLGTYIVKIAEKVDFLQLSFQYRLLTMQILHIVPRCHQ